MPLEPKLNLPGLRLSKSTISFMLLTGKDAPVTITLGAVATWTIGKKSLSA